jgi:polar amino acid transport system permease protein
MAGPGRDPLSAGVGRSFQLGVLAVWGGLLLAFVAFVNAFDLDFALVRDKLPTLLGLQLNPDGALQGVPLTLLVSVGAMAVAVVLGLLAALGKISSHPVAYGVATFYNSFFRGTPLLVQILLIYLGLPQLGPVPAAIPSGIAALSLCYGAYLSEIFRAAIESLPAGQWQAGEALGMRRGTVLRQVILPQALKNAVPPVFAMFISMLKDSSLVSVMGLWEVMFLAQSYGRASYRYVEMLLTAAAIYWLLSIVLEFGQALLERRLRSGRR